MKLGRTVHGINLYKKKCFLLPLLYSTLGAMSILSLHSLIMGKMINGNYFYLIVDILTNILQKCLLSGSLPNIQFFSKPVNLIGCHGNQKAEFANNIQKSTPQKIEDDKAVTLHTFS